MGFIRMIGWKINLFIEGTSDMGNWSSLWGCSILQSRMFQSTGWWCFRVAGWVREKTKSASLPYSSPSTWPLKEARQDMVLFGGKVETATRKRSATRPLWRPAGKVVTPRSEVAVWTPRKLAYLFTDLGRSGALVGWPAASRLSADSCSCRPLLL